jgi:hypothetical protein
MQTRIAIALGVGLFLAVTIGRADAFPISLGGASGMQLNPGPSMSMPGMVNPTPTQSSQRFRQLNVTGDVGLKEANLPAGARIVRLRVDGRDIYMRLDTELSSAVLQFDPNAGYAQELYRAILTKRIEVVGKQELRDQIMAAADKAQPLKIEGYVFDRTSPFLVVKSVTSN